MRRLILPWQACVVLLLVALAAYGVEYLAYKHTVLEHQVASNYTCNITDANSDGGNDSSVELTLDCGGKKYTYDDTSLAVSYFKNPGPVKCQLKANGWIRCNDRPKKAA